MATVVNFIDATLESAASRTVNLPTAQILLTPSAPAFHLAADGTHTPDSITFTASLLDIEGSITFDAQNGTLSNVTATTATLAYADKTASSAIVTASITVNGQTYAANCFVSTVQDGADGAPGAPGAPGQDGVTTYTWIKYATSAAGAGLSDDPTGMTYIGLAYNKTTPTESTVATDYAWSLIKGAQGDQGVPGQPGADGITHYTWIKYSDNADGTGLYDTPTASTQYIGIAVNKTTATESSLKTDYVWSKFKGDQGVPGTSGAPGSDGPRGPGNFYAAGNSWSDAVAVAACPGGPVVSDQVTISNTSTFTLTKRWDGSAWNVPGAYLSGDLFVDGTIQSSKVDTRELDVRDAAGNIILDIGGLRTPYAAPGTLNSEQTLAALGQSVYRVIAWGASSTNSPAAVGLFKDGQSIPGQNRSYNLAVFSRSTGAMIGSVTPYDVYGTGEIGGKTAADLASDLNSLGSDVIVVVYTYDEPYSNRLSSGLPDALYRCGASPTFFGTSRFKMRSAYVLVGIPGIGQGQGLEAYKGDVDNDASAWTDCSFSIVNGSVVAGTGFSRPIQAIADAQSAADAANAAIANISSDNVLSKGEKLAVRKEYEAIDAEWATLIVQADNLGVNRDAYNNAHQALGSYLVSLGSSSSEWYDSSKDTAIDGATFRQKFTDCYNTKQALINAMNAKAATMADNANVTNRYEDPSNLVKKGSFDDGTYGGWQVDGIENVVSPGNGFPYAKNIWVSRRDCLEANNSFPVTPGETLYFAAWMESTLTDYPCDFGVFEYDKNGGITTYAVAAGINPRTGWTYVTGSIGVAPGATTVVPWILMSNGSGQGFTDANGTPNQFLRVAGLWIGRHAPGATVGAPSGTNVGSTPAQTVESNAAAGKSASDAIPDINTAIASKLAKDANDTITGQIGLQSQYSLLVGDATNGVYMGNGGIFMVQGGVVKASMPISGNPTFAGQLLAAFGSFGAVSIASGGYLELQATAYNSDPGIWMGFVGSTPKLSIVASNGAKLLFDPTQAKPLQIVNADISGSLNGPTVTLTNHASGTYANGTSSYGSVLTNISGGTAPYSVSWACSDRGDANQLGIGSSDNTGASIKSVNGTTTNSAGSASIACTVSDSKGLSATASVLVSITCGTGA